jgi:hypothetical protein
VKQNFAAIILGGTGQVGGAAVAELLATSECREVVMITRKAIAPRSRVRAVVLDTGAADFAERTAALARGVLSQGPVSAVSCMGMKEDTVRNVGFARLAIFRPGIIVGNAHTPAWVGWLGSLVPGSFGNIDQRILGRSIAAEIAWHSREAGEVTRENAAMKKLAAQFNSVP